MVCRSTVVLFEKHYYYIRLTYAVCFLPDFQFLQGLLDVLPLVSNDSTARSALWSILQRVLCRAEENDDGSLDLHRLILLLLDKHFLIENDIGSHASNDFAGDEGKEFVIATVSFLAK